MKIAILGLGGVGGTVAGALKDAEQDLVCIVRGKTKEAVEKNGFLLDSELLGMRRVHPALISDDPAEIGVVDILILCCKGYSLEEACERYASVVGEETIVVPLLNGVTASREVSRCLHGKGQIAEGYIYCYSFIAEPGIVTNRSDLLSMGFGFADGRKSEKLDALKLLLQKGGMPFADEGDVLTEIWKKYLMMCGNSAAFLYYDGDAGCIQQNAERMAFLERIYKELYSLGLACGAKLPEAIIEAYLERFRSFPVETTSSLYRDVRDGNPQTELDAVIGGGCRLAEEKGIVVPCLKEAYEKAKERTEK